MLYQYSTFFNACDVFCDLKYVNAELWRILCRYKLSRSKLSSLKVPVRRVNCYTMVMLILCNRSNIIMSGAEHQRTASELTNPLIDNYNYRW